MRPIRTPVLARLAILAACFATAHAASAQIRAEVIVQGLSAPVAFVPDPTSSTRFFIVQQGGLIRVLDNGQLLAAPLLDLSGAIAGGGERGLLGMAFAPDAAVSGRFFVNFTNPNGHTVVARFRREPADALVVSPGTRVDLRWPDGSAFIRQPASNHNGGHLAFGPDGLLYIGLGDGGGGNDPQNHAQNPMSLLGKMLRIDVGVTDDHPTGYVVPAGNPFVGFSANQVRHEIWSFGLRNPWRYSFDDVGPGATGALTIGDVGQGAREEVNWEPAGAGGRNYGWRIREGTIPTPGIDPGQPPAFGPLTGPLFDYPRPVGRAVTGGYVYRGSLLPPAYRGRYFVADSSASFVASVGVSVNPGTGEASAFDPIIHTELGTASFIGGPVSFGRDLAGELYLVTFAGRILKIVPSVAVTPGPPSALGAAVLGRDVTLNWTPPAGGAPVTGYRLEAGSSSGAADVATFGTGTATSTGVGGVPDGRYFVRVRAESHGILGPPSNEVEVLVEANCSAPPQAPGGLSHAVAAGGLVTLAWTPPPGAVAYRVEAGSASGASNLALLQTTSPGLSVPAPTGDYYVRVRALNLCGAGAPSNEVLVTVP